MTDHVNNDANETKVTNSYGDYFIKSGRHVGDYEGMYRDCDDPWNHLSSNHHMFSDRMIALNWMKRLRHQNESNRIIEFGCGMGHLTKTIKDEGFSIVGIDVAQTAIDRARKKNPGCVFVRGSASDPKWLQIFQPDILYFANVTWCILDDLDRIIEACKEYACTRISPVYMIHLLATFPPGEQKYGIEKFSNGREILNYFNLKYLEAGELAIYDPDRKEPVGTENYFVAIL